MSSEQQELVDLLRNELAEIISYDTTALISSCATERLQLLEDFEIHCDNIGNAAKLVGLRGLSRCCEHLSENFVALVAADGNLSRELATLLKAWPKMLLGYLQYFAQPDQEARAVDSLLEFLADAAWPEPLTPENQQRIQEMFFSSTIEVDEKAISYPSLVTDEMASLAISDDINPELLRGLLTELPAQVDAFDRAVEQYLITGEAVQLRIAQRVAHTVKGAANVVGVAGVANLTHYLEDILEGMEKSGSVPVGVEELLQDSADCLSSMSEFLVGIGPMPTNVKSTIEAVLMYLRPHEVLVPEGENAQWPGAAEGAQQHAANDEQQPLDVVDLEDSIFCEVLDLHANSQGNEILPVSLPDGESPSEELEVNGLESASFAPAVEHDLGEDWIPLLDDIYHVPSERVRLAGADTEPRAPSTAPAAKTVESPLIVSPLKGQETAEDTAAPLTISESQAQELLRLTGESQIGNTQILNRLEVVATGVRSTTAYQLQLHQLAQELERVVELQTALASASGAQQTHDMDPLELERLNELNSFASQLHEVTTDAYEAAADLDDELKFLKGLVQNQRQLGFASQELLLNVRMLPVSVFMSRFTRCVRQATRLTGKSAELTIQGEDVLVDSRVLSAMIDPLMHLLRNAVDHGLEGDATTRKKQGKSAQGKITLAFSRLADTVRVECIDDGCGLDYEAIATKAVEKGLAPADATLSVIDLNRLILSPGFTTRDEVTQTSGRGVGLDVVNEQIKSLKGTLSIDSRRGEGTSITLIAPMTTLSAHTLLVTQGQSNISIVSRALEQIVYVETERLNTSGPQFFYTLPGEDQPLPVFPLDRLALLNSYQTERQYKALIVTRNQEGARCGVLVESVIASEEQIIKPLNRFAMKIDGVVGATILGDGRVSPVVDLYELPGLVAIGAESESWRKRFEQRLTHLQQHQPKPRPTALIVDDSLSARRSLAQFVGDMGMEVFTAKDGFEAIALIEQRMPQIILVDLEMPRMNGLELTQHLRANEQTKDIPIIMITSRATEKHKSLATRAGVNSYLNKPWTDEELLVSINSQMAV